MTSWIIFETITGLWPLAKATQYRVIPDPNVIGQWCVIHYDKSVSPEIIQDIDNESAEVNCMCSIGNNRFFWGLVEDCIW
jgi:hypothetical protein